MNKFGQKTDTIIRKSPIVIIKNFLFLQIAAVAIYVVAGSLTHYARIYRSLSVSKIISFQIAQAFFVFGIEIILVFYIFFRWYKEYFRIDPDKIIHGWGILYRHKVMISLDNIFSVVYHQGPLGKLVKHGTIELKEGLTGKVIKLKDIPEPQEAVDFILKIKQQNDRQANFASPRNLEELLLGLENENLEFKSTFRWDMKEKKVNRNLEKSSMKTIAAFLNSGGGHLVLGADDQRNIVGLDCDYKTLGKPGPDGFENHFSHIFHNMIGAEFRQFVKLLWTKSDNKDCCVVRVKFGHKPVYLKTDNNEEFYIRTGNGTTSLKLSEAAVYIDSRF